MTVWLRRFQDESGFTLVELLVVLAISGMLMALMVNGFRDINDIWRTISSQNDLTDHSTALRHFLRNLLSQCFPEFRRGADGQQSILFFGTPNEIQFLGPLPASFGTTDIVQYRLTISPEEKMTLSWRFDRQEAKEGGTIAPWTELGLASHLRHPSFSYFGADSENEQPAWRTEWKHTNALPLLIRVHIEDSANVNDKDLLITPLISAPYCSGTEEGQCSF